MGASVDDLERVRLMLLATAEDAAVWPQVLAAVADACSGRSGQLIARDGADRLLLHLVTDIDPQFADDAEENGLGDLARNPRLRIGHRAPLMTPLTEEDWVSPDVRRKYAIYPEVFDKYDAAFNSQAVLLRNDDLLVRTSVTRTRAQGPWEAEDLKIFAALLPYIQAAARQQLLAERRAVDGLLTAAEASGGVLFILNRFGWLIGASSEAERLLGARTILKAKARALHATSTLQDAFLQAALASGLAAWRGGPFPPDTSVTLSAEGWDDNLSLKVVTLPPRAFSLSSEPAVLILGAGRSAELEPETLRRAYRLSPAEIEIVRYLRQGFSAAEVASARGVALGTVRFQLKSIFRKVGVSRQAELVARVRA